MSAADHPWSADWSVGLRVWVERAGKAVLGKGRLELLEGIDRWRSISAAARQMGMSYRRAWLLVQSANEAAGEPLVEAVAGGSQGGGARLTPRGRLAVAVFRELQEGLHATAASLLPRLIRGTEPDAAVHVAAAVSLEEVLGQLLADYALRQPAVRVRTVFGASDELADHILAGAPADLFLTADDGQLDRLEAAGLVEPDSRRALAANTLAAIGPADRPLTVRRPRDLLRPEVAHVALAEPASPLGGYTRTYLEGLGLYESLQARAVHVDNSRAVAAAVHAGRAEAGLAYASDAVRAAGCRVLFRVRPAQAAVRYTAAVLRRGRQPDRARALLAFLTAPPALRRFRACGFLPVRPQVPGR
jgi:molybdenum ABC transporter molybdate-binding protein